VTATRPGARTLGSAYIALAATMWSLAGIVHRQLDLGLVSQIAGRAAFAIVAIFVVVAVAERDRVVTAFRDIGRPGHGGGESVSRARATVVRRGREQL
jgi:hypothetical protein